MRQSYTNIISTEKERFQQCLDVFNKHVIFTTNCDLNLKYDTKGFSDLIEEIKPEPHFRELIKNCGKLGGSSETFKMISKLEFHPIDEFFEVEETQQMSDTQLKRLKEEVELYLHTKCLGSDDSEVEPLTESDKNAFSAFLQDKQAPYLFARKMFFIPQAIDSEQKFKNLGALVDLFLT